MKPRMQHQLRIHALLKALRVYAELQQEELGHRIVADQSFVSRIESGRTNVTMEVVHSWAQACGGQRQIETLMQQLQWLLSLVSVNAFRAPMRLA